MNNDLKNKWYKLNGKEGYYKLLDSGLFYEIFPEFSGNYEEDKKLFQTGNKDVDTHSSIQNLINKQFKDEMQKM